MLNDILVKVATLARLSGNLGLYKWARRYASNSSLVQFKLTPSNISCVVIVTLIISTSCKKACAISNMDLIE